MKSLLPLTMPKTSWQRCTPMLVLLCHKFNLTSQQHGQRGSLLVMARAMSNRNVEIESGTCRWTRWAASRDVTFG
jgi:hypothetical protein